MSKSTKSTVIIVLAACVLVPVAVALSMVVVAASFAVLYAIFADAGLSTGWSLAWDEPVQLGAVAIVVMGYKTIDRIVDRAASRR